MKKLLVFLFLILILIINAYTQNAHSSLSRYLEVAGRLVLQTLDETDDLYNDFSRLTQSYFDVDPVKLGNISGRYTWCKNVSLMLSDNLTSRSDINFWLRIADDCQKMIDLIGEMAVFVAVNTYNNRFMDIFYIHAREVGNTLMRTLALENGLTPP